MIFNLNLNFNTTGIINLAKWLFLSLLGLAFYALVKVCLSSRRPKNFPPGPKTIPILGNLHQLPSKKQYVTWADWRKVYGGIIGLKFGPQNVVILNNYRHVRELYDKRGSLTSSRPENYVGNELICPRQVHILLIPYGDAWRQQRKVVQSLLNVTAVDNLLPIQNAEAIQTLHQLLKDPEGYYDHFRRYSTAVVLASVFGQRGTRFNSPKVQALYHAQDRFTAIMEVGATPPVDAFPWLKYLPEFMCGWKREARAVREEQGALYYSLLEETRRKLVREEKEKDQGQMDCFMAKLLRGQEESGLDDEHLAYLGGILMEAGSDTTSSTLLSFVLALIKYPRVLQKAQQELDSVCGVDKLPSIEDFSRLPYMSACVSEILRWRPIAAGGIPHVATQDLTYDDDGNRYLIPKGTMLFANAWAIHRDPAEYLDPDDFMPERFLDGNRFGTIPRSKSKSEADPHPPGQDDKQQDTSSHRRITYAFGAGRRVCPGQRLAENSLMVNMVNLVWAFDMVTTTTPPPTRDDNVPPSNVNVDTSISTAYTDGFLTAPIRFPVRFRPRSASHEAIIEREFSRVRPFLAQFGD